MKELILASSSPRRRELLSIITRRFTVQTSDCDEAIAPGTGPVDAVRELSLRKARAVWAQQPDQRGLAVIGSDTVVYIDGEILGKPHSHGEAAAMISRLGRPQPYRLHRGHRHHRGGDPHLPRNHRGPLLPPHPAGGGMVLLVGGALR